MPSRRPLGKKFLKSLLPILLVLAVALFLVLAFIVYGVTRPPRRPYLVTPKDFSEISGPVLKVTEESWLNRDSTQARGWLLRGAEGAPAVVLAHRYGADRSWLFNLGVKINETTNFTILWPDLRGHGLAPTVNWTSFGAREGDDILAALDFLRMLKTQRGGQLVADHVGLYGVELGAYASLNAARGNTKVRVLVLDSVPRNADEILQAAIQNDLGISIQPLPSLTRAAVRIYFLGGYQNTSACELAASLPGRHVLLLSGHDAGYLRDATADLARCFQDRANLEVKTDLPLTGFKLPSATGEEGERYDRQVIDFLDRMLRQERQLSATGNPH
jgi:hypothetical protein